jgi:hypothetical protein
MPDALALPWPSPRFAVFASDALYALACYHIATPPGLRGGLFDYGPVLCRDLWGHDKAGHTLIEADAPPPGHRLCPRCAGELRKLKELDE